MPNLDPNYIDLEDLNLKTEPSYNWQNGSMYKQEKLISEELVAKGYVPSAWRDGEKDSFGPLSREAPVITPDGEHKVISYG